jgi:DNA-directed RNA polymerase specialized sigma24 family protein
VLLANDDDAQRVVTDVFGMLYDRPAQYLGHPALSVQIYALTTRACFSRLRSRALQRRAAHQNAAASKASSKAAARTAFASAPQPQRDDVHTRANKLRDVLGGLTEPLGQLAVYYYLDELSQEEVCAVLGCPKQRVVSLLTQLSAAAREGAPRS